MRTKGQVVIVSLAAPNLADFRRSNPLEQELLTDSAKALNCFPAV
jgi:hypothetical protein